MILVTGGAGYIGSHVVKALSEAGEEVIVFDNLVHGDSNNLLHGEKLIQGDIRHIAELKKVFAEHKIEAVIHLAALVNAAESVSEPELYQEVNDLGSRNVWEAALTAGVKHLLYAGSAAVYGNPGGQFAVDEDAPLSPTNPYGATKLAGENTLRELAGDKANHLIFRFFNVAGAESEGRLGQSRESAAIMQRLFATTTGKLDQVVIHGHDYDTADGTTVRDFVHVEDIALAFVLGLHYLRKGGKSEVLNLGGGQAYTLGQLIKEVELVSGQSVPLTYGPRMQGDIEYSLADIRKVEKVLGWEPVHTLRLIVRDGYHAYQAQNR